MNCFLFLSRMKPQVRTILTNRAISPAASTVVNILKENKIHWRVDRSSSPYTYTTTIDKGDVKLRVGVDFPDEDLYQVMFEGEEIATLNDFPDNWTRDNVRK